MGEPSLPIILLMGPTAAGKTALAVRLAERLPVDIVSVDSSMVYRGMDIGTGKPRPEVLAVAPHRLIDIRDVTETYSSGEFQRDALHEIETIRARGRIPLLVGGTLLYFRALERGLAPLPRAAPEVRARLEAEAEREGWDALHARLATIDPRAAQRIHPHDRQRIQRALEVFETSGRTLSEWHEEGAPDAPDAAGGPFVRLVVAPPDRGRLHRAIETRFHEMLVEGLVEEVRGLAERPGVGPELPSMRAVGYRQVLQHLAGECDHQEMTARAIAATRQLARRQLTWLRALDEVEWLDPGDGGGEVALSRARERIERALPA